MMSKRLHAALVATLLCGMVGCRSGTPGHPVQNVQSVRASRTAETCKILNEHVKLFGLQPTIDVTDDGCRIEGSASLDTLKMEADPLDVLRDSLIENGWTEALEFAADGPGTSSYRVVRDGEYCQVDGGAPAWIDDDDEIRQSNEYHLNVECRTQS